MTTNMVTFLSQYSDAQKELRKEKAEAFAKFERSCAENKNVPHGIEDATDVLRSELRVGMLHFEQTLAHRYEEAHRPTFH